MRDKEKYTYSNYYKKYYEKHKQNYYKAMKKYLEKNKRNIIYRLMDNVDDVLYVGSTDSKFRINHHINGYSTLELTEEHWQELNCKCFEYAFIDGVYDILERLYIEQYLINKHKGNGKLLNSKKALSSNNFDEAKKYQLEEIAENLEFKVFQ